MHRDDPGACAAPTFPIRRPEEDPAKGWTILRWLGGRALGLVPVVDPSSFAWAGPWIARIRANGAAPRAVVMYGIPSGVAWDPSGVTNGEGWEIEDGFVIAPLDVALAPPPRAAAPTASGTVEEIRIAPAAGVQSESRRVRTRAARPRPRGRPPRDRGRHLSLRRAGQRADPDRSRGMRVVHAGPRARRARRNVVTRGIELNGLVGHEFTIGSIRCRGMRLCEPCIVIERYASRPILRPLVHRGGLRADILEDGTIAVGDTVAAAR